MSIRETVKRALINLPGNTPIAFNLHIISDVGTATHSTLDGDTIRILGTSQIVRALRELPNVKRNSHGAYIVKGRKVS